MNRQALQKVIDHLIRVPDEDFDMRYWCGSPCCVAGHARLALGLDQQPGAKTLESALDLDFDKLFDLTAPGMLPNDWAYQDVPRTYAIRVLTHLRDTGKVDWMLGTPYPT